MEQTATVYGLCSSRDGSIRYVGQTAGDVTRRLSKHEENARRGVRSHLYNWMRSEAEGGHQVVAFVIESNAAWGEAERRLIAWYRSIGALLVNGTDGGDGALGRIPTDEQRAKMSASHIGKKVSAETIAKRSATLMARGGRRISGEHKAALIAANTGKKLPPDAIARRTETRRAAGGYVVSKQVRERQSAAITAWWGRRKGVIHVAP